MSGMYSIPLNGLKDGSYSYDFEVGDSFFEGYDSTEIKECEIKLVVELRKLSGHYDLAFFMTGRIRVTCDRCLEEFYHPVDSENQVVVKMGHEFDDSDPELLIIPEGHHELDLSQMIYDFAHLALPIKRVHPEDEEGNSECDPEMIARIGQSEDNEEGNNPEWEKLKRFLHKN
jgi:uncharacterized protein